MENIYYHKSLSTEYYKLVIWNFKKIKNQPSIIWKIKNNYSIGYGIRLNWKKKKIDKSMSQPSE